MNVRVMIPWSSVGTARLILRRHRLHFHGSHHHRNGAGVTATVQDTITCMLYSADGDCARQALERAANEALRARERGLKKRA